MLTLTLSLVLFLTNSQLPEPTNLPKVIIKSESKREIAHVDPSASVGRYREVELNRRSDVKTTFGYFIAPHLVVAHIRGLQDGFESTLEAGGFVCNILARKNDLVLIVSTEPGITKEQVSDIDWEKQTLSFTTLKRVFYNSKQISQDKLDRVEVKGNEIQKLFEQTLNKCAKVKDWNYESHGLLKPKCR